MFNKVIWIICVLIIITVSTFVAFKVKSSFIQQPSLSELKNIDCKVELHWLDEEQYKHKYPNIENLSDLEENSQVILKVRVIGDGDAVAYSLRRKCKVMNSIKGDVKDEIIYIYEPSYIQGKKYSCYQGYLGMEKDKEYIVFLKQIENSDLAVKKELSDGYIFATPPLSKYSIGEKATLVQYDATENDIYYNEVSSLPVFFNEQKYVDLYNKILSEIENSY